MLLATTTLDRLLPKLRQADSYGLLSPNRALCQCQASVMIVARSERFADHPSNWPARVASATRIDGSPGRRRLLHTSILAPVIAHAVSMTSRTDVPFPLARFTAMLSPPSSRYWSARTCAWARSDTCT